MNIVQPILYFKPHSNVPIFIDDNIHYYQDRFNPELTKVADKLKECQDDFDINHLKWNLILDSSGINWYNTIDGMCRLLLEDAKEYPNRPRKYLPNYKVIYDYVYHRYDAFKRPVRRSQGRKHHRGYSYRNAGKKGTGERYYALMSDDRYYKSIGEPPFRKRGGKLLQNSSWDKWELEGRTDVNCWKSQGKHRHQWEAKVIRNANN